MAALYPVFLKLDGQPVLVVGGGSVAAGKLDGLIAAGAHVTLVAPQISPAVRARSRNVRFVEREFRDADLDGVRWVVAAATPDVNRAVSAAATARNLFVNAVDDPDAATAYLGGVVRRGDVTVAISTTGVAPALAGLLREALDAVLPTELERWLEVAHDLRREWRRGGIPIADRRPLLLRALDALYREPPDHANRNAHAPNTDDPDVDRQDRSNEIAIESHRHDHPPSDTEPRDTGELRGDNRHRGGRTPMRSTGHRSRGYRLPLRIVRRRGAT